MGLKEVFVLPVAKHWISGVDLDSAMKGAKKANANGYGVVVNFLGEEIKDPGTADSHTEEYFRLQQAMADNSIRGHPSVKLTQLGLAIDQAQTSARLERIAANAEKLNQSLFIDMEGSKFVESTLAIYFGALEKHPKMGVALQSYMRRSEGDLKALLDKGARIRLVKGAYREPHDLVLSGKEEIRENFKKEAQMLFDSGDGFRIATHDSVLVDAAKKMAESKHVEFEFEMLKGIRDELKRELVSSGYKVSEYLPYGDQWFPYSKRRLTEHPSNIWLAIRSLV